MSPLRGEVRVHHNHHKEASVGGRPAALCQPLSEVDYLSRYPHVWPSALGSLTSPAPAPRPGPPISSSFSLASPRATGQPRAGKGGGQGRQITASPSEFILIWVMTSNSSLDPPTQFGKFKRKKKFFSCSLHPPQSWLILLTAKCLLCQLDKLQEAYGWGRGHRVIFSRDYVTSGQCRLSWSKGL